MCLAILLWAVTEHIFRLVSGKYALVQIIWTRYAVHLVFMLSVVGPIKKIRIWRTRRLLLQICRGCMMIGMPVLAVMGNKRTGAGDAFLIFQASPILVVLMSAIWLKEKLHLLVVIGSTGAFIGALMMIPGKGDVYHQMSGGGLILLVAAAVCFGLYQTMTRLLRFEGWHANLFYTAATVFVPFTFMLPRFWVMPTFVDACLMAAVGLAGFFTLLALDLAFERAPASAAAPFAYILPALTILPTLFTSRAAPHRIPIFGGLLIFSCLIGIFCSKYPDNSD